METWYNAMVNQLRTTGRRKNERMKKIMKKFLSLLLALTMVMSLIVVPANAGGDTLTVTGLSLSAKANGSAVSTVVSGTTVTFSVTGNATVKESGTTVTGATPSYQWKVGNSVQSDVTSSTFSKELTNTEATSTVTVSCTVTYTSSSDDSQKTGSQTVTKSITVKSAQEAFEESLTKVTYQGRSYSISKNGENWSATVYYFSDNEPSSGFSANVGTSSYSNSDKKLTVKQSSTEGAPSKDITLILKKATPSVTVTDNIGSGVSPIVGHKYTLAATYGLTVDSSSQSPAGTVKYVWTVDGSSTTSDSNELEWTPGSTGNHTITCTVKDGNENAATSSEKSYTVIADPYKAVSGNGGTTINLTPGASSNSVTIAMPSIQNKSNSSESYTGSSSSPNTVTWVSLKLKSGESSGIVSINETNKTITGLKTGSVDVVATVSFRGAEYTVTYTVNVKALDETLDEIENGDYDTYSYNSFKDDIEEILEDVLGSSAPSSISSIKLTDATNVTLKDGNTTISASSGDIDVSFDLYAKEGFIGTASFSVKVNNSYVVTFYVPVTSAGTDIKESVTGSSTNGDVSFNVDDVTSGEYLYIKGSGSKTSFKPSTASFSSETGYDGTWSGNSISGWERFAESTTVTIPASQFGSTGKLTLYVVSVDKDGVATVGTLEVTQKSYSIEYNVVAGESVTFDQDDFEDLFKEYAEDNGDQTTRKNQDYPYVEYSHVTIAAADLPAAKSEGDLYYSSTALTSKTVKNEKFTDMDKMSFTAASKAKDTVTIPVTLVGTKYTSAKKSTDVKYEINVVISVVKEDIVYTVGVNDSVTFDARDFADYLNDYQTSYKKSTLDYVEFDVGTSNKLTATNTTGLLYQSYSSYYSGSLVESSNRFYYEPSRKQLDLGDVTYVTNRFSEVGKTVYIPFTVYGTKNEKAEGTLAIKVKNTMVFTDVVEGRDYFYDSVQWAVNNEITKGTSTTTFSPQKGCSRAEIVTFLWRAAGSPNPSKSTCSFKDVSPTKHADYLKAIIWATEKGITDGTTATTFSPDAVCTRAQIVTFLYRYAGEPASYGTYTFSDVSKTTHAAYYNAIQWAAYKGITNGNGTTTFGTMNTCNRAEAVTFLYRYFK